MKYFVEVKVSDKFNEKADSAKVVKTLHYAVKRLFGTDNIVDYKVYFKKDS
ncbi:hypothetical protein LCGC14_2668160 [marine sediment metagenome]|uniref:Uncharacterized protein n=1 Tax=marine sediment metagenome TaxID=412755 RepID=A0A0F9CGU1_9ZZZZ